MKRTMDVYAAPLVDFDFLPQQDRLTSGQVRYPHLRVSGNVQPAARNLSRETPLGRAIDWTGGADTD